MLLGCLLKQVLGNQEAFEGFEDELRNDGEDGCWDSALQDERAIVQREAGHDRLAEPAGADKGSERGRADVDDRCGLDASQDRWGREWQLDIAQPLPRREPD